MGSNFLTSRSIYSELLLYVSDQTANESQQAASVSAGKGEQVLMVGDGCGLARVTRDIFQNSGTTLNEYEGKALGYGILEKWAHLGIGVAFLPASKVSQLVHARRLNDAAGQPISIDIHACWNGRQSLGKNQNQILEALNLGG